jgi:putative ABC transport system ATP-binding protein
MLTIANLRKCFVGPDGKVHTVVDIPHLTVGPTEQVAIRGESGSGKTTLLHLIAGILAPDEGTVVLNGQHMTGISEAERDRLRAQAVGIVFQTFNLLQGHTVLENVLLGMAFGRGPDPAGARHLLDRMGLAHRLHHFPRQLSAGQQQRVAVARALANHPRLVLADEPTGNLDPRNSQEVLGLLSETCRENQAALLLVSHDPSALSGFATVLEFAQLNQAAGAHPNDASDSEHGPDGERRVR